MLPKSKVGTLLRRELRDEERRLTSGVTDAPVISGVASANGHDRDPRIR